MQVMLGFVALTPTYGSWAEMADRTPAKQPFAGKRMAADPVQGCVRELARQGQAILGVRFIRSRFLCALKEIGSGASPIRIETPCIESRPKRTGTTSKYTP